MSPLRSRRVRALALLALLPGCELDKPSDEPVTVLEVGPGTIFAAEFEDTSFTWWIVDPGTGTIAQTGTDSAGTVQITLDQAAGAYITTPSTTTAPPYSVELTGAVEEGAVVSYLAPDTAAFEGLRVSDGAPMAASHSDMLTAAGTLLANLETDLDETKARIATQAGLAALAATETAWDCAAPLHDAVDLDDVRQGTAGLPLWLDDVEGLADDLEEEVLADELVAQGNALELTSFIPDDAAIEADVEACLDLEGDADAIDAFVTALMPEAVADEDWTYDGRKEEDGELVDRNWIALDSKLNETMGRFETEALATEACVVEAVGAEPDVLWDDITETPYELLGADAELIAADREAAAVDCEGALQAAFGDFIDNDELGGELDPALYYAAKTNAWPLLEIIGGAELLDESDTSSGGGSGGTATPSGGATSRQAADPLAPGAMPRMAIENSSAGACSDTTFAFQFTIAGVGVAIGTPFDDVIEGADVEAGFEVMVGGKGDDCINGRKGNELIVGGKGNDELHGGDQHELVFGGPGDDEIFLGEGEDYNITLPTTPPTELNIDLGSLAFGGRGNDSISGSDPDYDPADTSDFGFTDLIFGDGINDESAGEDTIEGGGGLDLLFGQWADDVVENHRPGVLQLDFPATPENPATTQNLEIGSLFFGGKGNDSIQGSPSLDLVFGNTGDDSGGAGAGLDLVFGGPGLDVLSGEEGVDFVFGGAGADEMAGGEGIDLVVGGEDDDIVDGGPGAFDLVLGNAGNDRVYGSEGIDLAFGGPGQDLVNGGPGAIDLLFGGDENDTVIGEDGIDFGFGGPGRDRVQGGAGLVDLLFGGDETDIVEGQDGMDVILSGKGDDWVSGGAGFDLVWSTAGMDAVYGGDDLDVLFGGDEGDCIWGENGTDLAFGGEGADWISGGPSLDLLVGDVGDDQLMGEDGTDILIGGDDSDALTGGAGVDLVFGGGADDALWGGSELDLLVGGAGNDCIEGGDGFDIALGGDGDDDAQEAAVAFGAGGEDRLSVDRFAAGGDDDDVVRSGASTGVLLLGGGGNDHAYVATAANTSFVFGGAGDDTLTAPGATPVGDPVVRTFLFGNSGADWIQASKGKSRAFGNSGDDTMSGDADGSSTNDDQRDWIFGNQDSDALFGDSSSKRDLMIRGAGSDPSRTWDALPSTSPSWSTAHAAPVVDTCPAATPLSCDAHKEQPGDVGAPFDG